MLETKYGLCMAREHSSFNIYSCDTQWDCGCEWTNVQAGIKTFQLDMIPAF